MDIIELEYFGVGNKVLLFKCHCFDTDKGVRVHPHHCFVKVNQNLVLASNEPFALAGQCQQVCFTAYPSKRRGRRDWLAIFKTKARSRFDIKTRAGGILDLNDGVYQEVEVSNPHHITLSEELDNPRVIFLW
ncbi:hypothetical protein REPUB_Repub14bG0028400 [Reevesia pubescens]